MHLNRPINTLRVLTLNLWQRYGAWADRRSLLVDHIRVFQADLIGFAESVKTKDYDQTSDLLGPEFIVVHSKARDASGMGISIASRWPVLEVHELDLNVSARTAGFPCTTLAAEIDIPAPVGPLLFVNHFPNWQLDMEYERELQAVTTARFLEERTRHKPQHIVVVGDLDADPEAASIRFWSGRQSLHGLSVCYRDAWASKHPNEPGHTFTPENPLVKEQVVKGMRPFRDWPFRRIDYIFLRLGPHAGSALDITACERIFDGSVDAIWASDHFGLIADFALAPLSS
jgi:endonuclease/exonuclease/phosphatase family metal-dependent hydrolase